MVLTGKNSQRGFSLVELMVVVAIIGVLSTMAIPNIQKYIAKARQSEAKTNLSSLYTGEKAFFAEYNTFDSRFAAVGYTPEGQLRYNVGFFAAGAQAAEANGYNTPPAITFFAALTYCGANGKFANGCSLLKGATGDDAPGIKNEMCPAGGGSTNGATCTTAVSTFRAGAGSQIQGGAAVVDWWTIDDAKVLRNTQNGIR